MSPPSIAPVCLPSSALTNSQNRLPISAENLLSTLVTILIPTIPWRNYCFQTFGNTGKAFNKNTLLSRKKLIISKISVRRIEEIESKNREIERVNSSTTSGIQGQKMLKNTDIYNQ